MGEMIQGRPLVPGEARGRVLVSTEPLSFWGGYDPATGEIIDRRHPLSGEVARGRVLALPETRGSSTTTAILLEAVRAGNAPAALLTEGVDAFLSLAAVVAKELYDITLPLVALAPADFKALVSDAEVTVDEAGRVTRLEGPQPDPAT